ncbi:MAG: prolyl oligopeptidase family serine peptidase [Planctomycetota bacterium]
MTQSSASPQWLLLAVIFVTSCTSAYCQENEPAAPVTDPNKLFEPRSYADKDGKVLNYRLLKPFEYDPTEQYPLVIFLHGAGERGGDNTAQLKHGMADFCNPQRRSQMKCYVLAPQCPKDQKWADVDWRQDTVTLPESISPSLKLVFEVVDSMLQDAAIDKNRVYITGLSMGGYGTWDALYRRPDFFAAALPVCGGADPKTAATIKHIPVWCFHGDQDRAVKVEFSRDMIAALKEAGGEPKYTEYEGVGHNSWTQTYANPEVHDWLFSQRRVRRKIKDAGAAK